MKINIEHNSNTYQIDSSKGINISIPVDFIGGENPKFYDTLNFHLDEYAPYKRR